MLIRIYKPQDLEPVVALWRSCGLVVPWNDPVKDIQRKLQHSPQLFLVGEVDDALVASVMVGYEGHRGWINYLAVAPELQGQGLGRQLMQEAERVLKDLGCPKINLQIRSSNLAVQRFYRALGYQVDESVSMGKRLEHDIESP